MKASWYSALRVALCAASFISLPAAALAATYTVPVPNQFSRGWYDDTGFHGLDPSFTDNYYVGREDEQFRNFFIFPLPLLAPGESISSVSLVLYCPANVAAVGRGYDSPDPTETYQLFSIDRTSIAALRAGGTGLTGIFADLGDGISYSGGAVVSSANEGTDIVIPLNPAFLAYATANLGSEVVLGGAVTTLAPVNNFFVEGIFGHTSVGVDGVGLNQTRLIINTVPEPSSAALLLSSALFCLRRRSLRTHRRIS